jgi:hypothetical protein
LISDTIIPRTPIPVSASRTSSSLNGLIVAMMSFTCGPLAVPSDAASVQLCDEKGGIPLKGQRFCLEFEF